MDAFETISQTLKAHPTKAQVLLEVRPEGERLEKAVAILQDLGMPSVECRVVPKKNRSYIVIFLWPDLMAEAVLKLSEAGFTRLKGLSPRNLALKEDRSGGGKPL